MNKIKLEIEIKIDSAESLVQEYYVDNIKELEIVFKSEAKKDLNEFINTWNDSFTCTKLSIE